MCARCAAEGSRAHGLLDLAPTGDTAHLTELLKAAGDSDLVLTPLGEAAYIRTADRFNAMWALNSGLDFFLYWPRSGRQAAGRARRRGA